jgi:adenine-specific DNA-methyltransferase
VLNYYVLIMTSNDQLFGEKFLQKKIHELESELKKLKKQKKYGLVWEDKQEQIVEDCKRNVPILRLKEKKKGIDPVVITDKSKYENILIEGDNYHALSVLNYTHNGKVDLIYIDPPYNTGARDWKYNNDYVDVNDAYRHSKWISLMANRLVLAKRLLSKNGVLVIAIDDNEVHHLRTLIEQLMPSHDVTSVTVVHNPRGNITNNFARTHEYALFIIPKGASLISRTKTDNISPRKMRRWGHNSTRESRPTMFYPVYIKNGKILRIGKVPPASFHPKSKNVILETGEIEVWPIDQDGVERRWNFGLDRISDELERIIPLEVKKEWDIFLTQESTTPKTVWTDSEFEAGRNGATLVKEITGIDFPFPKSIFTIQKCVELVVGDNRDAVILDFFAGSGTTGHAVLELNKQDDGNRKFILCTNNESDICEEVTYERIRRVMVGYKNNKGEKMNGLGGNLRYYKTDLVDIEKLQHTPDHAKVKLTYQAGEMIGLRENTLNEIEKNDWWQIFEGHGKSTAIYFKEDKEKLQDLVELLEKKKQPSVLYIFGWGKNEYKGEYSSANIRIEDIPEPILEVYKEINRL